MKGLCGCLLAVVFGVGIAAVPGFTQSVNVTTWHNDVGRTGQNTNEVTLTTSINKNNFGKLCSYPLTEQIYAQPLVLASITIGGTQHEAVYVVTEADNIYVFDGANYNGTTCILLQGPISLIPSNEAPVDCSQIAGNCKTITPTIGALGTPVIDASTNTLYVVTESQYPTTNPTNFYHRLHALDLTSANLAEKYNGPATIPSTTIGGGGATFHSRQEIQRPGLLLTYEEPVPTYPTIYIAFSMMDGTKPNPSGWIFAYDAHDLASTNFPLVYTTVQNPETGGYFGGGIWQGGGGLVAAGDKNGSNYLYFSTADGVFDANNSGTDYGDSFVKLTTELQPADYFTPADAYYRWDISCPPLNPNDLDFGSGGVIAIPADRNMNAAYQNIAIKADKENYLWVMDRTSPGKSNACISSCSCSNTDGNIQKFSFSANHGTSGYHARSTPAFWDDGTTPFLYFAPTYGQLSQYPLNCAPNGGPICAATATTSVDPSGTQLGYAATPSISSNGTTTGSGIVWAINAVGSNALYAFDAESLAKLYYSKDCPTRDQIGTPAHFAVPTIANGNVFLGTLTDFDIFGPTAASCI
jgi:hypothetical protein